jgi:pyrimidine-nucleoside phosphorylase
MIVISNLIGRKVRVMLSDMNQPLGVAVGNAVELKEAIDTMHGQGPQDFTEHCLEVATQMVLLGHKAENEKDARALVEKKLADGSAWERFHALVKEQKGDVSYIDHPEKLPGAPVTYEMKADQDGYLMEVLAQTVGETAVDLETDARRKRIPSIWVSEFSYM